MSRIHKINFFFACIILAIDSLNGFFLFKGINFPVSIGFKLLFTITMVVGLFLLSNNKFYIWFFLFVIFSTVINIPSLVNNPNFFFESLILSQKFLFTVLTYFYFTEYFKTTSNLNYNFVFNINFIVIISNIILSIIGLGYYAYDVGVGFTGFFFAPNEISFLVLIICSHFMHEVNLKKPKYFLVIFILFLIISVLLAMKVVIIGVFLVGLFIFFRGAITLKKITFASVIFLLLLSVVLKYSFLLESFVNMLEWRYNNSENLINFILSDRDTYLIENFGLYINSSFFVLLFGIEKTLTVEMDLFDVLFNYGLIGFIIIYLFFAYVALPFRKKQNNSDSRFLLLVNILVIITSLFVGHFVFSAMGGFFFAYFNAVHRNTTKVLVKK